MVGQKPSRAVKCRCRLLDVIMIVYLDSMRKTARLVYKVAFQVCAQWRLKRLSTGNGSAARLQLLAIVLSAED
jgi:hypothetical protein